MPASITSAETDTAPNGSNAEPAASATSTHCLRFAMVCASNQNRSMEAHAMLKKHGLNVESFGTAAHVKLPGPGPTQPNVYKFGTPYATIYNELKKKDPELYTRNGLLRMLQRNMSVKSAPQRWQENREPFDVVVTFEERVFDAVEETLTARAAAAAGASTTAASVVAGATSSSSSHVMTSTGSADGVVAPVGGLPGLPKPCLVINLEVRDSHDEAAVAAPQALRLAQMLEAAAAAREGDWVTGLEQLLDAFQQETGRRPTYSVCWC